MAAGVTLWRSDITKSNCLSCAVLFQIAHKNPLCYSFKVQLGWPRLPHSSFLKRGIIEHHTFSPDCQRMEWRQCQEWLEVKKRGIWIWIQLARCVGFAGVFTHLRVGPGWLFCLSFSLTLPLCPSSSSSFPPALLAVNTQKTLNFFTENLPMHMKGNPLYFSYSSLDQCPNQKEANA